MTDESAKLLGEVTELVGDDVVERLAEAAHRHRVMINLSIYPHGEGDEDADDSTQR